MASDESDHLDSAAPPPAPALPHPNFGWALLWCLAFILAQLGAQTAGGVVALLARMIFDPGFLRTLGAARSDPAPDIESLLGPGILGFSMFCQEAFAVIFALVTLRFMVGHAWRQRIALVLPRGIHVGLAILAMPGMLVVENLIHQAASQVLPGFHYQQNLEKLMQAFPLWFALPTFALGPGLAEELMFRGFLGRGLVARHGPGVGVLLTSLLFGLMHLDPPHIVATAVMGVVLHYVYLTGGSIWLPILMHTLNNGLAVLAAKKTPGFDRIESLNPWTLGAATLLLLAVGWALYDCRTQRVAEAGEPAGTKGAADAVAPVERLWLGLASGLAVLGALVSLLLALWLG